MQCNSQIIKNIKGLLVVDCAKPAQSLSPIIDKINEAIMDKYLLITRFYNPDALSANNTDATIATDSASRESVEVSPMRVGVTAVCESCEGTLIKALQSKGSLSGFIIDNNGGLWGKKDDNGKLVPVTVKVISVSLPNGLSVSGTNLPAVQLTVDFGTINEVAEWRLIKVDGADSADDYLIPEVADLVIKKTTDLEYSLSLADLLGNDITTNTSFESCFSCSDSGATWSNNTLTVTAVPFTLTQTKLVDGFMTAKETYVVNE